MGEKLVFESTMDSLVRQLGRPLSPAHVLALAGMGVETSRKLEPAYPVETYTAVLDYVASQRWPTLPPDEAHFQLGRAFLDGFMEDTLAGRALRVVAKTFGPHRVLERMARNFHGTTNYTRTKLKRLGPSAYSLWFNYAARPGYFRGLLTEALDLAGAEQLEVRLVDTTPEHEATFHIQWVE
jgi:uncharacterized protein (TIGR02265 family)